MAPGSRVRQTVTLDKQLQLITRTSLRGACRLKIAPRRL